MVIVIVIVIALDNYLQVWWGCLCSSVIWASHPRWYQRYCAIIDLLDRPRMMDIFFFFSDPILFIKLNKNVALANKRSIRLWHKICLGMKWQEFKWLLYYVFFNLTNLSLPKCSKVKSSYSSYMLFYFEALQNNKTMMSRCVQLNSRTSAVFPFPLFSF